MPAPAVVHLFESMYLVPDRSERGSVWLHCFFFVVIFMSLSTSCHLFMLLMFEAYRHVSFQINILLKLPFQKQLLLKINVSHVTLSCVAFSDKIQISANKDKSNGGCQHSVVANYVFLRQLQSQGIYCTHENSPVSQKVSLSGIYVFFLLQKKHFSISF